MKTSVRLDVDNLERFVGYLSELVKFRKSVAGQRALMTQALRKFIKERDDYTCQECGISSYSERNLLLEIDHIIPLAKGGITSEDNLQTLCWKCNRSKGAKVPG
jgi:5-methylcytosine-specific restriction endonuclease McrA